MNDKQKAAKQVLQNELRTRRGITKPLPDKGESKEGYSFTEVERVTVCIGPRGGYILPAVRSYGKALDDVADSFMRLDALFCLRFISHMLQRQFRVPGSQSLH